MSETPSLGLPLLAAEQAQKHVTLNEALRAMDAIVQLSVKDRDLATPPGAPTDGDRYIVAAGPTGAWTGQAADIAVWQDNVWAFHDPREGWRCWVDDEDVFLVFDGSAWADWSTALDTLQNLALLGLGTTADATNPFAAKLNKALWTAKTASEGGDGDLRTTLNKEAAADVLSILLQSGFSGRAELGLIGDDGLTIKVSPDGSAWNTALVIDKDDGSVDFPSGIVPHGWGEPIASWFHSSDVASVDFIGLGAYRELLVIGSGLQHNNGSNANFFLRTSTDNGTSFSAGGGDYANYGSSASTTGMVCNSASFANTAIVAPWAHLINFNVAGRKTTSKAMAPQLAAGSGAGNTLCHRAVAEANDALRLLVTGGSIVAGNLTLYGKK